jgi:thiol-disulfide isomerase/thioredoxin
LETDANFPPSDAPPVEASPGEAAPGEVAPTEAAPGEAAPVEASPGEVAPTEAAPPVEAPLGESPLNDTSSGDKSSRPRIPGPLLTSDNPMLELIFRSLVAFLLSLPLSLGLARAIVKPAPQGQPEPKMEVSPARIPSPISTTRAPLPGAFPVLNHEAALQKSEVDNFLAQEMGALPQESREHLAAFANSSQPTLLFIKTRVQIIEAKYQDICSSLPINCLALEAQEAEPVEAPEAQTNEAKSLADGKSLVTSLPIVKLRLDPKKAAVVIQWVGIYVFASNGDLIWWDQSRTNYGGTPEIILRTIVSYDYSLARQQQRLALAKLAETPSPDPVQRETAKPAPRDHQEPASTLNLHSFNAPAASLDPRRGTVPFNQSWAAIEASTKKKSMLIVFWATWCAPCVSETPDLGNLSRRYPSTLFVGLIDDPNTPKIRDLAKSIIEKGGFPTHYLVKDNEIAHKIFDTPDIALPAFALFDARGNLISHFAGSLTKNRALLESGLARLARAHEGPR